MTEHRSSKPMGGGLDKAERQIEKNRIDLEHLTLKSEKTALISQALWELVREHTDLTEEDIEKKIEEIDMRNGKIDGRIVPEIFECPTCNRKVNSRQSMCIYCGETLQLSKMHIFE